MAGDRDADRGAAEPVHWDLALRLFHWLLVFFVAAAWLLAEFGPALMTLHFYCGYAVLGLIACRLVWGVVGPENARLRGLFHSPAATWAYLRRLPRRTPSRWRAGHNPVGSLFVVAILTLLAAQAATGLISDPDDYINVGPLASWVGSATRSAAVGWHETISDWILILIAAHIAAILFYALWKREDLVRPMITGKRPPADQR